MGKLRFYFVKSVYFHHGMSGVTKFGTDLGVHIADAVKFIAKYFVHSFMIVFTDSALWTGSVIEL